jgi:hypothetical protein
VSPNADGEIIQVAYELLVGKWQPYRDLVIRPSPN